MSRRFDLGFGIAFALLGVWIAVTGRTWLGIGFIVLGGLYALSTVSTRTHSLLRMPPRK